VRFKILINMKFLYFILYYTVTKGEVLCGHVMAAIIAVFNCGV
jgi:hypothetical protein